MVIIKPQPQPDPEGNDQTDDGQNKDVDPNTQFDLDADGQADLNEGLGLTEVEQELQKLISDRMVAKKRSRDEKRREALRTASQDSSGDTLDDDDDIQDPASQPVAPAQSDGKNAGQQGSDPGTVPLAISPTPSSTPSGTSQPDSDTIQPPPPFSFHYNDEEFDQPAIEEALQWRAWANSLPEEARLGVNAYLTGTHILVERSELDRLQKGIQPNAPSQTQTQPSQTQTSSTPELSDEDLAELPPGLATWLKQQQAQQQIRDQQYEQWMKSQAQQQQQFEQQQTQQQHERIKSGFTQARQEIIEKYALTDDEFDKLDKATSNTGLPAAYLATTGDPHQSFFNAFDNTYLRIFQQRELTRQIAAQQSAAEQVSQQQTQTSIRKSNAAKLNPSGASVSPGNRKVDRNDSAAKRSSLIADIQEALQSN